MCGEPRPGAGGAAGTPAGVAHPGVHRRSATPEMTEMTETFKSFKTFEMFEQGERPWVQAGDG
ncbi:hypothetical protein GCM10017559_82050 [Streptosporangium longisporum]|uniref:Uncharacterized protein n=1 Tax=Streptosporangium longisporum TaxID=46187 RepID=A0ABP6LG82_9ACTN